MLFCLSLLMLFVPNTKTAAAIDHEKELAYINLRESASTTIFRTGVVARLEAESILEKVKAFTPDGVSVDSLLEEVSEATDAVTSATLEKVEWVNDLKPEDKSWEAYIGDAATSATSTVTSVTMEKVKWAEEEYRKRSPEIQKNVKHWKDKTDNTARKITSGTLEVISDFRDGWESGGELIKEKK